MRSFIVTSVIAAMLFAGAEGVAEPVDETSFHQTHHMHGDDGQQWYPDSDGDEHDHQECQHFCHLHVVAVPPQVAASALPGHGSSAPTDSAPIVSREIDPPTPPPNI